MPPHVRLSSVVRYGAILGHVFRMVWSEAVEQCINVLFAARFPCVRGREVGMHAGLKGSETGLHENYQHRS
jgi:hypothetical protein